MMMDIRPIRNDDDLAWALAEVEHYFDNEPALGSPEADRFDLLSTLIEAYEDAYHPIPDLDPVEAIRAYMELKGLSQANLSELVGHNRSSEILNRKRRLSVAQIAKLQESWGIPATVLVKPYHLEAESAVSAP